MNRPKKAWGHSGSSNPGTSKLDKITWHTYLREMPMTLSRQPSSVSETSQWRLVSHMYNSQLFNTNVFQASKTQNTFSKNPPCIHCYYCFWNAVCRWIKNTPPPKKKQTTSLNNSWKYAEFFKCIFSYCYTTLQPLTMENLKVQRWKCRSKT